MAAHTDGPTANGAPPPPLEGRVSRQEQANAAAARPGRTKRDLKRKAPPASAPGPAGDMIRVEGVPKGHPALYSFPKVEICKFDRAPEVELSEDRMGGTFRLGFRMARATHGVYQGTWYFEVTITHLGESGHCRLGWSTRLGEGQAPVGYDGYSFGYRDVEGSKVHKAVREAYGKPFREGDVVGCLIHLPPGGRPFEFTKQDIVSYRSGLYFLPTGGAAPGPLPGSFITFFLNGESQGTAYRDMLEGTYHPALSMYTLPTQREGATATFNFGPDFKHPPPQLEGVPPASPMCLLANDTGSEPAALVSQPAATLSGKSSAEAPAVTTPQPAEPPELVPQPARQPVQPAAQPARPTGSQPGQSAGSQPGQSAGSQPASGSQVGLSRSSIVSSLAAITRPFTRTPPAPPKAVPEPK